MGGSQSTSDSSPAPASDTADVKTTSNSGSGEDEKKKLKPCCACPETKKIRDECIIQKDASWLSDVHVNQPAVERHVKSLLGRRAVKKEWQAAWLLKAISLMDLTTLGGDDCFSNVERLSRKGLHPLRRDLAEQLGFEDLTVAAICVYPAQGEVARKAIERAQGKVTVACVATAFPTGLYPLSVRLADLQAVVDAGYTEVDVVIRRELVLEGRWEELYNEVSAMKKITGDRCCLKTILGVGELGTLLNVYKASVVCMAAGSDFIKTSTGKEAVNATLPVGVVMARAIRFFKRATGIKVGIKAAGGIRTATDALNWLILVKEELGNDWLCPDMFRIGASSLLLDIERQLFHFCTGRYAAAHEFDMS
ncbi:unnamed protein product [Cyprideis torosa]|uniref:deoxyribose-phosphate aldolase n=1 Tax=Cyprideis torosa TaxID=163714 RepID=A0A7R8W6R8_9CRUS|nr:unnamed protein product [Cyprideis torosa]CAG0882586.1 unnamed protein product [Cyprideis torosa]